VAAFYGWLGTRNRIDARRKVCPLDFIAVSRRNVGMSFLLTRIRRVLANPPQEKSIKFDPELVDRRRRPEPET